MMAWKDNKFSSPEGQKYVSKIFDLIFAEPMFSSNKIETQDLNRQVSHFKNNMLSIVNLMKKFVVGYAEVPMSEAVSSGIHICPHCMRRDFIWNWEMLDAGHYSSPNDWVSSVEPKEWKNGLRHEQDRYLFMARYKCNNVTTCNACKITVTGHHSSCKNCGKDEVVKVGCGKESYAKHFVREYTFDNNHPTNANEIKNIVAINRTIPNKKNRRERKEGKLVGYEVKKRNIPSGKVIKTAEDLLNGDYLPYVQFTYEAVFDGEVQQKKVKYPLSELNFALNKQRVRVCRNGLNNCHQGRPNELPSNENECKTEHLYLGHNGFLQKRSGTRCGAYMPPEIVEQPYYYKPSLMRIMSNQPLNKDSMTGRTKNGLPVHFIHLEGRVNSSYKILLPLPTIETLQKIPDAPEPTQAGSGITQCPNDVGSQVVFENMIDDAKEQLEETKEKLTEQLKAYYNLGPADAVTSDGYSFVVCEGRSKKAKLVDNEWIDESPPCKADGKEYPRWNEIPSYADPSSTNNSYLGPNPRSHFVQDWLKASEQILSITESPPVFHSVYGVGEMVREAAGVIIDILECQTCKGIVEAKGVIKYRESRNECDENGVAINDFPQSVLDAEIEYEKSFPLKNDLGDDVPTAWGIIASQDHNGKEMLKKVLLYKFS